MPNTPKDPKWGTCRHCPKQFRAYRKNQLFCSTKCRVAHHRASQDPAPTRAAMKLLQDRLNYVDRERLRAVAAQERMEASLQRASGHLQEIEKLAKIWGRNAEGGHTQGRHFQDPKLLARQFAKIAELVACIRDPNRQDRRALGSEAAVKRARDEAEFQELAAVEDPFGDDDRYGAGERGVSS